MFIFILINALYNNYIIVVKSFFKTIKYKIEILEHILFFISEYYIGNDKSLMLSTEACVHLMRYFGKFCSIFNAPRIGKCWKTHY